MSVNALNATGVDSIANQLLKVFDRNKDGQLSSEEFGDVMRGILGNLADQAGTTGTSAVKTAVETHQLEGFSHDKLQTSDSVKYRFARAAAQFDVSTVHDKPSAEALLTSMKPAFAEQGLDVLAVKGDRIKILFEGSELWVDVIRGSSGTSPAYQWLPEGA